MFRPTVSTLVTFAVAVVLGLAGLAMLVLTLDEYRAGRAYRRAMAAYPHDPENVRQAIGDAIAAKGNYDAPQETQGKLLIDAGHDNPGQYKQAQEIFNLLAQKQQNRRRRGGGRGPSLAVLIGRAVADLEAARAATTDPATIGAAIAEARRALEAAQRDYPDSGDLLVNLATIALHRGNAAECTRYLKKAVEVGNVSRDALPHLYNLSGLVALHTDTLPIAIREFEKVKEFDPAWIVPQLNLAAAHAQSLLHPDLEPRAAAQYARTAAHVLNQVRRRHGGLVAPICHALAVHHLRGATPKLALGFFAKAQEQGPLGWHARYNQAAATYLTGRALRDASPEQATLYRDARRQLQEAIAGRLAKARDTFAAYGMIATTYAAEGKTDLAIQTFHRAEGLATTTTIADVRKQLPSVQRSLAALYYTVGNDKKALEYLDKTKDVEGTTALAAKIREQLSLAPVIRALQADRRKLITPFDVQAAAEVQARATIVPLTEENIKVVLHDAITGETRPLHFRLNGTRLSTIAYNLPQGRFTLEIQAADVLGNTAVVKGQPFEIDREPPRFLNIEPAPGAAVGSVGAISFRVQDAISRADLSSLSVSLKLPSGKLLALVSLGKYRYKSPDGTIKAQQRVDENVTAHLPRPAAVGGAYTVAARCKDSLGKQAEATWTFTVR